MRSILDTMNVAILLDQLLRSRAHDQMKGGGVAGLLSEKLQEARLRDEGDIGIAGVQALKVERHGIAPGCFEGQHARLRMLKLEQALGQAKLLQDLHGRRM